MTLDEINAFLKRFSVGDGGYKAWDVRIGCIKKFMSVGDPLPDVVITLSASVPMRTKLPGGFDPVMMPGDDCRVHISERLSGELFVAGKAPEHLLQKVVLNLLEKMVVHEAHETLLFDGQREWDPHR